MLVVEVGAAWGGHGAGKVGDQVVGKVEEGVVLFCVGEVAAPGGQKVAIQVL